MLFPAGNTNFAELKMAKKKITRNRTPTIMYKLTSAAFYGGVQSYKVFSDIL
jgi:hypothetical protein